MSASVFLSTTGKTAHKKQYLLPLFVPGAAEFFNMRKDFVDEHPEVCDFFERMSRLPLRKVTPMVPLGGAGIGMHVVPVEKAIPADSQSVSIEHLSHWLKKYDTYAVGVCSCRRSQTVRGEGAGDLGRPLVHRRRRLRKVLHRDRQGRSRGNL